MKQYYKRMDLRKDKTNKLRFSLRSKEDNDNLDQISLNLAKICGMPLYTKREK